MTDYMLTSEQFQEFLDSGQPYWELLEDGTTQGADDRNLGDGWPKYLLSRASLPDPMPPADIDALIGGLNAVLAANLQRPQDDTTSEVVVTVEDSSDVAALDVISPATAQEAQP